MTLHQQESGKVIGNSGLLLRKMASDGLDEENTSRAPEFITD